MNRFQTCLKFILAREGGYSNRSSDRGGATNYGITQHTADVWAERNHLPRVFVKNLTMPQVEDIYFALFWLFGKCPYLRPPLDLVVFDSFIQHRPDVAAKIIQRALGVDADGILGKVTLAAAAICNPKRTAMLIIGGRRALYENILKADPSQAEFAKGWNNRMDHLTTEVSK